LLFWKKEYFRGKKQLVQDLIMVLLLCIYTCVLCTHTNTYMPRFSSSGFTGPSMCRVALPDPLAHIKYPMYSVWSAHTRTPKKGGSNLLLFDIHMWDLNYARSEMSVAVPTLFNPCRIGHCSPISDKAPTNKIYRRASSEQRPRTRWCHESERLV